MSEERRNATQHLVAGGSLIAAGMGADALVARDRAKRGMKGPIRAAVKREFTRRHAGQLGVKTAATGAKVVGIPMAAYGGYKMLRPEGTQKPSFKRDVVDRSRKAVQSVTKAQTAELSQKDQDKIRRRKKVGSALSLTGAGIGTAALALRAPEAARALTKVPRVGGLRPVRALAGKEGGATKLSNTLLAVGAGSGAAGGFNYADQQRLEAKQFKKADGRYFSTPEPLERDSARGRRVRTEAEHQGYRAASVTAGAASTAAVGARWLGHKDAPKVVRAAGIAARTRGVPNDVVSGAERRALKVGQWAKNKRGRLLVGALAAGGVSAGTGAVARWKRDEAQGLSHELGRANAGKDYSVRKSGSVAASVELGQLAARRIARMTPEGRKRLATGSLLGLGVTTGGATGAGVASRSKRLRRERAEFAERNRVVKAVTRRDVRDARKRKYQTEANRDLALGATAAAVTPALLPYVNRYAIPAANQALPQAMARFPQFKIPIQQIPEIPIPQAKPFPVGRLSTPMAIGGHLPGGVGRLLRNPKTIAAVGLGVGAPLSLRNWSDSRKASARYKELKSRRKQERVGKSLYDGVVRGIGRVRVVERTKPGYVTVYDSKDVKRFMPESRVTPVPKPKSKKAKSVPVDKPGPQGQQLALDFGKALSPEKKAEAKARAKKAGRPYPNAYDNMVSGGAPWRVRKRDDSFLRGYRQRISPEAEVGYNTLRRLKRQANVETGVSAAGTGAAGLIVGHALRNGKLRPKLALAAAVPAAAGAYATVRSMQRSNSLGSKMYKIRAKAYEREAAGQFGRGRVRKDAAKKLEGASQVAAGGAALGLGLSTNRLVNTAERRANEFVAARRAEAIGRVGNPVVRTVPGASVGAKQRAKERTKQNQGRINEINRKANKANRVIRSAAGGKTRGALITAGFLTAAPSVWLGSRKMVEKADAHDVDAFMGGALGTAGVYHGALYSTKKIDRRIERNIAADPKLRSRLNEHRKATGLPKDARKGDARWLRYHREYPKSIPGWRWKRTMSRLQGGKSQVAITGALAGAGGLGAAALNRKIDPVEGRNVKKAFGFQIPRGQLMRKSPLLRKPSVRGSYVGTSVNGKKFTVRGSVR